LPQRKKVAKAKPKRAAKPRRKPTVKKARKKPGKPTAKASSKAAGKGRGARRSSGKPKASGKPKVAKKPKVSRKPKAAKKPAGRGARKARAVRGNKVTARTGGEQSAPKTVKKAKVRAVHSKSRIEELRSMLEAKRGEILQEIKRAREDSVTLNRTSFAEVGDLVSASVEKEKAFEYGEAGVNALREINSALEKLKSGTYGICELCNKVISVKRLQIMPSARLCIKCKSKEEASGGNTSGR
jgi:DnaK suppressor protein